MLKRIIVALISLMWLRYRCSSRRWPHLNHQYRYSLFLKSRREQTAVC